MHKFIYILVLQKCLVYFLATPIVDNEVSQYISNIRNILEITDDTINIIDDLIRPLCETKCAQNTIETSCNLKNILLLDIIKEISNIYHADKISNVLSITESYKNLSCAYILKEDELLLSDIRTITVKDDEDGEDDGNDTTINTRNINVQSDETKDEEKTRQMRSIAPRAGLGTKCTEDIFKCYLDLFFTKKINLNIATEFYTVVYIKDTSFNLRNKYIETSWKLEDKNVLSYYTFLTKFYVEDATTTVYVKTAIINLEREITQKNIEVDLSIQMLVDPESNKIIKISNSYCDVSIETVEISGAFSFIIPTDIIKTTIKEGICDMYYSQKIFRTVTSILKYMDVFDKPIVPIHPPIPQSKIEYLLPLQNIPALHNIHTFTTTMLPKDFSIKDIDIPFKEYIGSEYTTYDYYQAQLDTNITITLDKMSLTKLSINKLDIFDFDEENKYDTLNTIISNDTELQLIININIRTKQRVRLKDINLGFLVNIKLLDIFNKFNIDISMYNKSFDILNFGMIIESIQNTISCFIDSTYSLAISDLDFQFASEFIIKQIELKNIGVLTKSPMFDNILQLFESFLQVSKIEEVYIKHISHIQAANLVRPTINSFIEYQRPLFASICKDFILNNNINNNYILNKILSTPPIYTTKDNNNNDYIKWSDEFFKIPFNYIQNILDDTNFNLLVKDYFPNGTYGSGVPIEYYPNIKKTQIAETKQGIYGLDVPEFITSALSVDDNNLNKTIRITDLGVYGINTIYNIKIFNVKDDYEQLFGCSIGKSKDDMEENTQTTINKQFYEFVYDNYNSYNDTKLYESEEVELQCNILKSQSSSKLTKYSPIAYTQCINPEIFPKKKQKYNRLETMKSLHKMIESFDDVDIENDSDITKNILRAESTERVIKTTNNNSVLQKYNNKKQKLNKQLKKQKTKDAQDSMERIINYNDINYVWNEQNNDPQQTLLEQLSLRKISPYDENNKNNNNENNITIKTNEIFKIENNTLKANTDLNSPYPFGLSLTLFVPFKEQDININFRIYLHGQEGQVNIEPLIHLERLKLQTQRQILSQCIYLPVQHVHLEDISFNINDIDVIVELLLNNTRSSTFRLTNFDQQHTIVSLPEEFREVLKHSVNTFIDKWQQLQAYECYNEPFPLANTQTQSFNILYVIISLSLFCTFGLQFLYFIADCDFRLFSKKNELAVLKTLQALVPEPLVLVRNQKKINLDETALELHQSSWSWNPFKLFRKTTRYIATSTTTTTTVNTRNEIKDKEIDTMNQNVIGDKETDTMNQNVIGDKEIDTMYQNTINQNEIGDKKIDNMTNKPSQLFDTRVNQYLRISILVSLLLLIVSFVFAHITPGVNVEQYFIVRGQEYHVGTLFIFSLISTAKELMLSGAWFLFQLIVGFSGIWPYIKIGLMLMCYTVSDKYISISTCHSILEWLDRLGKWSMIDAFVLVQMQQEFHIDYALFDNHLQIQLAVDPHIGYYLFVITTIASQILSHIVFMIFEKINYPERQLNGTKDYDTDMLSVLDHLHSVCLIPGTHPNATSLLINYVELEASNNNNNNNGTNSVDNNNSNDQMHYDISSTKDIVSINNSKMKLTDINEQFEDDDNILLDKNQNITNKFENNNLDLQINNIYPLDNTNILETLNINDVSNIEAKLNTIYRVHSKCTFLGKLIQFQSQIIMLSTFFTGQFLKSFTFQFIGAIKTVLGKVVITSMSLFDVVNTITKPNIGSSRIGLYVIQIIFAWFIIIAPIFTIQQQSYLMFSKLSVRNQRRQYFITSVVSYFECIEVYQLSVLGAVAQTRLFASFLMGSMFDDLDILIEKYDIDKSGDDIVFGVDTTFSIGSQVLTITAISLILGSFICLSTAYSALVTRSVELQNKKKFLEKENELHTIDNSINDNKNNDLKVLVNDVTTDRRAIKATVNNTRNISNNNSNTTIYTTNDGLKQTLPVLLWYNRRYVNTYIKSSLDTIQLKYLNFSNEKVPDLFVRFISSQFWVKLLSTIDALGLIICYCEPVAEIRFGDGSETVIVFLLNKSEIESNDRVPKQNKHQEKYISMKSLNNSNETSNTIQSYSIDNNNSNTSRLNNRANSLLDSSTSRQASEMSIILSHAQNACDIISNVSNTTFAAGGDLISSHDPSDILFRVHGGYIKYLRNREIYDHTNQVFTARYTWWNFIPKNQLEQMLNRVNLYFVFIGILQTIPHVSTTNGVPTIFIPFTIITSISIIRDAYEDNKRRNFDRERNHAKYWVLQPQPTNCSSELHLLALIHIQRQNTTISTTTTRTNTNLYTPSESLRNTPTHNTNTITNTNEYLYNFQNIQLQYIQQLEDEDIIVYIVEKFNKNKNKTEIPASSMYITTPRLNISTANTTNKSVKLSFSLDKEESISSTLFDDTTKDNLHCNKYLKDKNICKSTNKPFIEIPSTIVQKDWICGNIISKMFTISSMYSSSFTTTATTTTTATATTTTNSIMTKVNDTTSDTISTTEINYNNIPNNNFKLVYSQDIRVGNIIKLYRDQLVPCDMICLGSSEPRNFCFIDKSNLNGESVPELVEGIPALRNYCLDSTGEMLHHLDLRVLYEAPTSTFDSLRCTLQINFPVLANTKNKERTTIDITQRSFILHGTFLRNVDYIFGLVLYTGKDTTIYQNIRSSGRLTGAQYNSLWLQHSGRWYILQASQRSFYLRTQFTTLSWVIQLSTFVPISLIVSLQIIKFFQGYFLENDLRFYNKLYDKGLRCNTTSLHEDLSLIDIVMSDKTGTLTMNKMELSVALILLDIDMIINGINEINRNTSSPLSSLSSVHISTENDTDNNNNLIHTIDFITFGLSDIIPKFKKKFNTEIPTGSISRDNIINTIPITSGTTINSITNSNSTDINASLDIYNNNTLSITNKNNEIINKIGEINNNEKINDWSSIVYLNDINSILSNPEHYKSKNKYKKLWMPYIYTTRNTWNDSIYQRINLLNTIHNDKCNLYKALLEHREKNYSIKTIGPNDMYITPLQNFLPNIKCLNNTFITISSSYLPPSLNSSNSPNIVNSPYSPNDPNHPSLPLINDIKTNNIDKNITIKQEILSQKEYIQLNKQDTINRKERLLEIEDYEYIPYTKKMSNIRNTWDSSKIFKKKKNKLNTIYPTIEEIKIRKKPNPIYLTEEIKVRPKLNLLFPMTEEIETKSKQSKKYTIHSEIVKEKNTISNKSFFATDIILDEIRKPVLQPLPISRIRFDKMHKPNPLWINSFTNEERVRLLTILWGSHWNKDKDIYSNHMRIKIFEYMLNMALSNTARPYIKKIDNCNNNEKDEEEYIMDWQFDSAEEITMVRFAACCGFIRDKLSQDGSTIQYIREYFTSDLCYEQSIVHRLVFRDIAVMGFTSKRARVGLVYQRIHYTIQTRFFFNEILDVGITSLIDTLYDIPEDRINNHIHFMIKGQDTVILDIVLNSNTNSTQLQNKQQLQLKYIYNQGLRVLLVGYIKKDASWWQDYEKLYSKLSSLEDTWLIPNEFTKLLCEDNIIESIECQKNVHVPSNKPSTTGLSSPYINSINKKINKDININKNYIYVKDAKDIMYEYIENHSNIKILGCIGLEDMLQPLVPQTIQRFYEAGIKTWMITGDKVDTARHISILCNLVTPDMCSSISSDILLEYIRQYFIDKSSQTLQLCISKQVSKSNLLKSTMSLNSCNNVLIDDRSSKILSPDYSIYNSYIDSNTGAGIGAIANTNKTYIDEIKKYNTNQDKKNIQLDEDNQQPQPINQQTSKRFLEITGEWQNYKSTTDILEKIFDQLILYEKSDDIYINTYYYIQKACKCPQSIEVINQLFIYNPNSPLYDLILEQINSNTIDKLLHSTKYFSYSLKKNDFVKCQYSIYKNITFEEAIEAEIYYTKIIYDTIVDHTMYPISQLIDKNAFRLLFPNKNIKHNIYKNHKKRINNTTDNININTNYTINSIIPSSKNILNTIIPIDNIKYKEPWLKAQLPWKEMDIIDIKNLESIQITLREIFACLSILSKSVIFARAEPIMKKEIVLYVRKTLSDIKILAIGDGSNDSEMINAAHIGVSVEGIEGTTASNVSDYTVTLFYKLYPQQLVHGIQITNRIGKSILFIIYKAVIISFSCYLYGTISTFSGQQFFNDFFYQLFNIIFTPVIIQIMGIFDTTQSYTILENLPIQYRTTKNNLFTYKKIVIWSQRGFIHSLQMFLFMTLPSFWDIDIFGNYNYQYHGKTVDYIYSSTQQQISAIILANTVIFLLFDSITLFHMFVVIASIQQTFIVLIIFSSDGKQNPSQYSVGYQIFFHPKSILQIFLTVITIHMLELSVSFIKQYLCKITLLQVQKERYYIIKKVLNSIESAKDISKVSTPQGDNLYNTTPTTTTPTPPTPPPPTTTTTYTTKKSKKANLHNDNDKRTHSIIKTKLLNIYTKIFDLFIKNSNKKNDIDINTTNKTLNTNTNNNDIELTQNDVELINKDDEEKKYKNLNSYQVDFDIYNQMYFIQPKEQIKKQSSDKDDRWVIQHNKVTKKQEKLFNNPRLTQQLTRSIDTNKLDIGNYHKIDTYSDPILYRNMERAKRISVVLGIRCQLSIYDNDSQAKYHSSADQKYIKRKKFLRPNG